MITKRSGWFAKILSGRPHRRACAAHGGGRPPCREIAADAAGRTGDAVRRARHGLRGGDSLRLRRNRAEIRVLGSHPCPAEPTVEATLFQSLPKLDKFDSVVQKAVELGVSRIVPVVSARCVSRPEEKALAKKTERWQRIAAEAAKQCGPRHPACGGDGYPLLPGGAPARRRRAARPFLFYEGGAACRCPSLVGPETRRVSLFIGPEGGFAPEEVTLAQENGLQPAHARGRASCARKQPRWPRWRRSCSAPGTSEGTHEAGACHGRRGRHRRGRLPQAGTRRFPGGDPL